MVNFITKALYLLNAIVFMFFPVLGTSAQENKKEIIRFGIIEDAAPIVVIDNSVRPEELRSFCGDLHDHLKLTLPYEVKQRSVSYDDRLERFDNQLDDDHYGIECGAITRTIERIYNKKKDYNATFTMPFYNSEIAFIAKEEIKLKIEEKSSEDINCQKYTKEEANKDINIIEGREKPKSDCVRVGVVLAGNDLTTNSFVNQMFPETTVQVNIASRRKAIERLFSSNDDIRIDAIASDKALLDALLYFKREDEDFSSSLAYNNFHVHSNNYTEEPYAVLVYDKMNKKESCEQDVCSDSNIVVDQINSWLMTREGRAAKQKIDDHLIEIESDYNKFIEEEWNQKTFIYKLSAFLLLISLLFYAFLKRKAIKSYIISKLSEGYILYYVEYGNLIDKNNDNNVLNLEEESLLKTGEGRSVNWNNKMKEEFDNIVRGYTDEIVKSASSQTGKELASALFGMLVHLLRASFGSKRSEK